MVKVGEGEAEGEGERVGEKRVQHLSEQHFPGTEILCLYCPTGKISVSPFFLLINLM